jgi:hypothetical protein
MEDQAPGQLVRSVLKPRAFALQDLEQLQDFIMKYLTVLAATSSLVFGALAAPRELPQFGSIYHRDTAALEERQGYAFSSWSESGTNVQCNNGGGGSFNVKWNGKGGFVCGKGWNPGSSRCVTIRGWVTVFPRWSELIRESQNHQLLRDIPGNRPELPFHLWLDD